jgi:hypothetical protein
MLHYQVVLKDNEKRVKSTAILYHTKQKYLYYNNLSELS